MIVSVRLFAVARDRVGNEQVEVDLDEGATVADLRRRLSQDWPQLDDLWPYCLLAVNEEYATAQTPISAEDTIACIPPVSGG